MFRTDLQKLAIARVADARALRAAGRNDAAFYLAGMAVECALKACIAAKRQRYEFPDRRLAERAWAHDLERLLDLADLSSEMLVAPPAVLDNWSVVRAWKVDVRYLLVKSASESDAFLKAVSGRGGVLPWVKQRW